MKSLLSVFIFVLFSFSISQANTTIVGTMDPETKDLIILVTDTTGLSWDIETSKIWGLMKGHQADKMLKTKGLEIECKTAVSEPQKYRYGSCQIVIAANRVAYQYDGYGALFAGPEGQEILSQMTGGESEDFPLVKELSLHRGQLMFTADHQRKLFAIRILNPLMH